MYHYNTPIRYVKGIGPTRSHELAKLGITTVGRLLNRHPNSYIYPGGVTIAEARDGFVVIRAKIKTIRRGWHGKTVEATLVDETGRCKAIWYHADRLLQYLPKGWIVTFYGKMRNGVLQQPKWVSTESKLADVYGGQYGVHHDTIRAALKEVLSNLELPKTYDGMSRVTVYEQFHFPNSPEALKWAIDYLKLDEALQMMVALQERRDRQQRTKADIIEI